MADNVVSTDSFDDLFAGLVTQFSGLSSDKVLISYSEKGKKSSAITEDVCYIHSEIVSDYVDQYKNRKYEHNSQTDKIKISQSSMRIIELEMVFYGPNANVIGTKVKEKFYLDGSRDFLYMNNLALIPEKDVITKTHENINGRWWDRVDVHEFFYNSVTIEEIVNRIVEPVVDITTDLEVQ